MHKNINKWLMLLVCCFGIKVHSMDEGLGLEAFSDEETVRLVESINQKRELLRLEFRDPFHNPPVFDERGDYYGNLDDPYESISSEQLAKMVQNFSCIPLLKELIEAVSSAKVDSDIASLQLVLEGPSGSGKTTFSKILAAQAGLKYRLINTDLVTIEGLHKGIDSLLRREKQCVLIIDDELTQLIKYYDYKHKQNNEDLILQGLLNKCQNSSNIFFIGIINDKNKMPEALKSRLQISLHMGHAISSFRLPLIKSLFKSDESAIFEMEDDDDFMAYMSRKMSNSSLRDLDLFIGVLHFIARGRGQREDPLRITKEDVYEALEQLGYLQNPLIFYGKKCWNMLKTAAEKSAPYIIPWGLNTVTQLVLQRRSFEHQVNLAAIAAQLSTAQWQAKNLDSYEQSVDETRQLLKRLDNQ